MRTLLLTLFATLTLAHAALTPDDLHGTWVVDEKAVTDDQKAAAAAAKGVEGFGVTFTLRTARVVIGAEEMYAGQWRLEDATATSATAVIQPRGGEERRLSLTREGKHLIVAELPGKLRLMKAQ